MVGDTFEVHIQTLKEQMRYDRTEFVVTPGIRVRLIFSNPDAMDHNLVMVQPGAAAKVAVAAMKMETTGEGVGKQWIPESVDIIFASNLLPHGESQTIEFTAPMLPGRYDYICTFPGHWQLMRGVMVVTDRIDPAKLALYQPAVADHFASNRKVVEYWEFDSLKDELGQVAWGRSYKIGKEMFTVASCIQCHKFGGQGETIGPDLTEINEQYSAVEVLEHILDPSLQVADEYKTYVVEANNKEYYGTILAEDDLTMTILDNPLTPETAVTVKKEDIEVMDLIDISPMPTDLLITLNRNEIWDLLAYVLSGDDAMNEAFE